MSLEMWSDVHLRYCIAARLWGEGACEDKRATYLTLGSYGFSGIKGGGGGGTSPRVK